MGRFNFGKNWQEFSKKITREKYLVAKQSLQELVGGLAGKSFLDVGCGSGLFSIAASALGAKKVVAFDIDSQCVLTAKNLLQIISHWDRQVRSDAIEFSVKSVLSEEPDMGQYDVVYSWGVLHHTGDMRKAFKIVSQLVAQKGILAIAIYNKHWTSAVWKLIKRTYIKSPAVIKKILIWLVLIIKIPAVLIVTRHNPFIKERGMSYYTDIVDWVGGYPYEYATPNEVIYFFEQRGFTLKKLTPTKGFTGCNEFVFERTE